ncbi:hypothetical protein MD588_10720 [Photobacterium sp. SDRW27]|uniref:hypothetical protein n=1 Tax=Photobacterium obscurum TaxID=2829490 RepID=UPI002244C6DE|nr:hypothetical protein [Photobacterium obscurum]MCW8329278.1 hypothetical protein [Photobacterium obscurum]
MKPLLQVLALLAITTQTPTYAADKENISLPFNEYNALKLLAKWKVSTVELPQYIDTDTNGVYGADHNHNHIRDDYEQMLLSTYHRPEYVVMGLLAAKKWDRLLDIYTRSLLVEDVDLAKGVFAESIAINRCYYHLQAVDNSLTSPVLAYFNTDERLQAKKSAEDNLLSVIGDQHNTLSFSNQPCTVFSTFLKTALSSEQPQDLNIVPDINY